MTENENRLPRVFAAFVALYLAAANALLAMSADTCTGGSADSPIGIVYSLFLFGLALLLLRRHRFGMVGYAFLIIPTVLIVFEAKFALELFWNTHFRNLSICTTMFKEDYGPGEFDDQWVIYAWALTYLVVGIEIGKLWIKGLYRLIAIFR